MSFIHHLQIDLIKLVIAETLVVAPNISKKLYLPIVYWTLYAKLCFSSFYKS